MQEKSRWLNVYIQPSNISRALGLPFFLETLQTSLRKLTRRRGEKDNRDLLPKKLKSREERKNNRFSDLACEPRK
mgnify:CR=1 FL=1